MPKVKLTAKVVENARSPAPGLQLDLFDATLPAFGLRVGDRRKTWFVIYRFEGKQKRHTLGHFPTMDLGEAREAAGIALGKVEKGIDPAAEKEQAKAAARKAVEHKAATGYLPGSFGQLATLYMEQECGALRRGKEIERIIRREVLEVWRDRRAEELRRRDLTALLDPIVNAGQVQKALKLRTIIVRIINWAVDRGDLEANLLASASKGRKKAGILRVSKRDRVLSNDELRDVWRACDELSGPFPAIVKTLILTGQRRTEVGGMRWAELDLEAKLWTIPADRYKTMALHVVPLSPAVVSVIESVTKVSDDFVFATNKDTHFSGFSKCKERLDKKVSELRKKVDAPAMPPWTLHDLRRTVRTGLSGLRISSDIAERVIGHVIRGVEGVYDRHAYLDEKREALDLWAARVLAIVNPPPANVVPLRASDTAA